VNRPSARTVSIQWLLPVALGLIIILALVPVIAAGYIGARDNTARLLQANSDAVLDGLEDQLRTTIEPVSSQMAQVARFMASGRIDPADRDRFGRFMLGVVSGSPNVNGIGFLEREGPFRRWRRDFGDQIVEPRENAWLADDWWPQAEAGADAVWLKPFVSRVTRGPVILRLQPVRREGRLIGIIMASITLEALSDYVMTMNDGITPFVLQARETVLVHPNLRRADVMGEELPNIRSVEDRALAIMWNDPRRPAFTAERARSQTHWSWIGEGYLARQYHYREITGYGPDPWVIGFHQDSRATMRERWVVQGLLYGSLAALLVLLLAVWRIGVIAARPAAMIAESARNLEELKLDRVDNPDITGSRIDEVRQTAHALSRAALALRRVQTYIPRALVSRLVTMGDDAVQAMDAEVTILFADLAGYTRYSEGRSAQQVASYLNRMFACMGPIIEGAGGTIDKYTGDGLLAVWGAPTADPDHAGRAWATALAIQAAMDDVIREGLAQDARACRLRIGVHSGRVVAGDLGFAGRTDFTVVGRTVNTAQRTQAAMKDFMGEHEAVVIGVTGATLARIDTAGHHLEPVAAAPDGERIYKLTASG
jgi:adenylate cyclase